MAKFLVFKRYAERPDYEHTLAKRVFEPILDFVVRAAEIIFLAAAFQAAANAAHNTSLHIAAIIMGYALAFHFGIGWGRVVYLPLSGVTFRAKAVGWVIVMAIGIGLAILQQTIWHEVSEVSKAVSIIQKP